MSHEISGQMVYSFEQPMWHAIVKPSTVKSTAVEIMENDFQGGQSIFLRPVTVTLNGEATETGDYAIVRSPVVHDPKEIVFGYCTDRYQPLQPIDVAKSFDVNVLEYVETMAFLSEGKEMFISWKMPSFDVNGDQLDTYGIVRTGFDTLKGTRLFTSIYRPVCKNTINMAEGWAKGNGGSVWKGKAVNKNLLEHLGYWMSHVQTKAIQETNLLRSFFGKLATTEIRNDAEAKSILADAYPIKNDPSANYPKELRTAKAEKVAEFNESQEELQNGIFNLFAGKGTAITPDYYGLFNATTEYFCHVQASKRPIAESVMFGARQQNSMKVVNVLAQRSGWK